MIFHDILLQETRINMIFHDILLQETRIKSKESLQNDDKE